MLPFYREEMVFSGRLTNCPKLHSCSCVWASPRSDQLQSPCSKAHAVNAYAPKPQRPPVQKPTTHHPSPPAHPPPPPTQTTFSVSFLNLLSCCLVACSNWSHGLIKNLRPEKHCPRHTFSELLSAASDPFQIRLGIY